jgi:CRP/FNR family transcriptional regulator, cyclic AMP receptor protein
VALRRDAKAELLKSVPLFAECSKGELAKLASIADEIDLRKGTVLTREGKTAHEFFVIVDGTVRVSKGSRKLADLGPGDWLGEIALLTKAPRTATATATSPVQALVIVDRDFRSVVAEIPSIAMKMLSCVAERLTRTAQS